MSAVVIGIGLALATSACWALGNVLTQKVGRLVGPPRAMLWSMAAGAVLAAPFALVLDTRTAPITGSVVALVALAAFAGVIAYIGLFFAFANASLSIAVPVVSSWPVVTAILSVALFHEALRVETLGGAAVLLVGVALVSLGGGADGRAATPEARRASRIALGAGFASALGFGVMIPVMAHAAPATGAFGATAAVYVLGIVLGGGFARAAGVDLRAPPRSAIPLLFATGAAESLGFVCVSLARKFAPMTIVAPVATLSSTLTVLAAWVFLGERPGGRVFVGAALACVGVVLLSR